jgi:lysozyme
LNLTENLHTFLDGLEQHYGVKPIIYSGVNFANKYMNGFGSYPLWLAEYKVTEPNIPKGWSDWTFWQWSQSSTIDGIEGNIDRDRYNGDETSFDSLLIK